MELPTIDIRLRRILLGAYTGGVLVLTLAPLPASAGGLPRWFDKVVHFGLFVGLSLLLYWNLSDGARPRFASVVGWVAVTAGAIELVQSPLAFRSGDVWDLLWGVVGALVGYGVVHTITVRVGANAASQ